MCQSQARLVVSTFDAELRPQQCLLPLTPVWRPSQQAQWVYARHLGATYGPTGPQPLGSRGPRLVLPSSAGRLSLEDQFQQLSRQATSLRTWIATGAAGVAGVTLLAIANSSSLWADSSTLRATVRDLGSLCVVSVALSLLWELAAKRSFSNELWAKARVATDIADARLHRLVYRPDSIAWQDLLKHPREIDLLFAYGRMWRATYERDLRSLLARDDFTLRVVLPDYEDAGVVGDLARRFSKSPEGIRHRVQEAVDDFVSLATGRQAAGRIEIWLTQVAPVFSLFRLGDVVVIAMYSHQQKDAVPHFVASRGGSLYDFASRQFSLLVEVERGLSRCVFPPDATISGAGARCDEQQPA